MSKVLTRPATLVRQGSLVLYATSFRVRDLMIPNFYDIERLDPKDLTDKGYQRLLNKARAKKLADYLIEGEKNHDAFLPTSIFLATEGSLDFDPSTNHISFDVEQICPFSVVDGQHRLEGLKMAAEKSPGLLDFEVPVNIAVSLSKIAQMAHFLIVNTTQKSVDAAVEQRIYARLHAMIAVEDVPTLPKWVRRIVESGEDEQALGIVDYLNEMSESPWYGKIRMPVEDSKGTANQRSFVKLIKRYVLVANNPVSVLPSEKQRKILLNYWRAIANLLDDGRPTVLYKYNGIDLFSRFSTPLFSRLQNVNDFKVPTIERALRETFDNLDGDSAGVGHPEWWLSGTGTAGTLNAQAIGQIHADLTRTLQKLVMSPEIVL